MIDNKVKNILKVDDLRKLSCLTDLKTLQRNLYLFRQTTSSRRTHYKFVDKI